ncbi:TRAP transporter small permease [Caldimonas thermodepolymerans]|jgi:TRAP-type C4-dicarboxylate transport system, small permease component|uniref:TRAP transporter small permease protein n=1 Tax=Caldimonas thermodepolymerans TaxID=215580 RepID=A0A2S5T2P8_9BURK|nr:TRAP transporter small permease [Caldimonas thermodepolymerans]PPE69291.1 TRAP transporter small permease [Caldimonas thermodepolymerans]QPC31019.1 TRAP transporter small permease [Caldimonas thermodepolymerans]RDH96258.1 TRAP-type C4-dicarboxylate transport system permease small subunit [Caldimonas thermodepolymerans]TCP04178.1 TRAP-type C4-dicarboxylate transport system permease small subunit [Caldimonas thermodepolymerans]UZG43742.1 TRAP transporter small permease [Caldimonas thermodepol
MLTLLRLTAQWFALVGGLCAGAVAVLTVVSIAGRSLWSTPLHGDFELTQFGTALCISLCLPWCQLNGGNIIVDFFTARAGRRTQAVLDGIGAVLLSAMMALLAWRTAVGAQSVLEARETSMILGLPMWVVYAVLAPGFALTLVIALCQAWAQLRDRPWNPGGVA